MKNIRTWLAMIPPLALAAYALYLMFSPPPADASPLTGDLNFLIAVPLLGISAFVIFIILRQKNNNK